jgi:gamma-glutamylcyclotransferase (GGCT)/AIG2-like uncharacterized protein YtfP
MGTIVFEPPSKEDMQYLTACDNAQCQWKVHCYRYAMFINHKTNKAMVKTREFLDGDCEFFVEYPELEALDGDYWEAHQANEEDVYENGVFSVCPECEGDTVNRKGGICTACKGTGFIVTEETKPDLKLAEDPELKLDDTKALYVFVYGTLQIGKGNDTRYDSVRVGVWPAIAFGKLYNGPGYPFAQFIDPTERGDKPIIRGELHAYKDVEQTLKRLDALEGFRSEGDTSNLYERIEIMVSAQFSDKARQVKAWAYEKKNVFGSEHIIGGRW